jgi:ATP-binding cassette subfamily F protein uup
MDKIVDHLFILEDKGNREFPGNYSDFRAYEDSGCSSKKRRTKQRKKIGSKIIQLNFQ